MKIYTTAQELVKPTVRMIVRKLSGAANGGVPVKDLRKSVIAEYQPMMTVIDGHFGKSKIPMIQRTFNYMVYGGVLDKSGLAVYVKDEKSVYATNKGNKMFEQPLRINQDDLVIPAVNILRDLCDKSETGRVKTSDLFKALSAHIQSIANEEDMKFNVRKEPRYLQVIRNLISHRVLDKTGLVKYHSETKELEFLAKAVSLKAA